MENFIVQSASDLKNAVESGRKIIDLSKFENSNWEDYIFEIAVLTKNSHWDSNKRPLFILSKGKFLSLKIENEMIVDLAIYGLGFENFDFLYKFNNIKRLGMHETSFENLNEILSHAPIEDISISSARDQEVEICIDSFVNIKHLKQLTISDIKLNNFELIYDKYNLEYLDIMDSNIKCLDPLSDLLNLKALGLFRNKIRDLAPIRRFIEKGIPVINNNHPVVEWCEGSPPAIAVACNPLENPPMEIVVMGNWAILDYFDGKRVFPGKKRTVVIDDVPVIVEIPYEILNLGQEEIDRFMVYYSRLFLNKKYNGTASQMINTTF